MIKTYQKVLFALVLGGIFGKIFPNLLSFFNLGGDLFLRALKALIVPLVFASLATGVSQIKDLRAMGRLGFFTMGYFILTSVVAILLGLVLATLFSPGEASLLGTAASLDNLPKAQSISDIFLRIVPQNPIQAFAEGQMLQVIFLSLLFGIAVHSLPNNYSATLKNALGALNALMMKLVDWVLVLTPYGVFALMAKLTASTGFESIQGLLAYMGTVLLGLLIHAVIIIPLLTIVISKQSPLFICRKVISGVATTFSAASSAAGLPLVMSGLMDSLKQDKEVTAFVMPLGITLNMNGTALYQAVATVFIAQCYGIELGVYHFLLITITGVLAAVSAAAVPSAGLITLTLIMSTVGVPLEGIGMIVAVDRLVDMSRSGVNIWTNACATVNLGVLSRKV